MESKKQQTSTALLEQKTISDFGSQWGQLTNNLGYYGSQELFQDIVGPDFDVKSLKGKTCLDIGSGTGRIVSMLLGVGASHIYAVEPAPEAFSVLRHNTLQEASRITYLNQTGENFSVSGVDIAVSFGVIHHIPDPRPTLSNIYKSLKPGGKFIMWVYGHEGNELYLKIFGPIRKLTTHMSDGLLHLLSKGLNVLLGGYIFLCEYLPLPMHHYMRGHLGKLSWEKRYYTIFDQLNPAYAKYYFKEEAVQLLGNAGFKNISTYHRHGYSWTLVGEK